MKEANGTAACNSALYIMPTCSAALNLNIIHTLSNWHAGDLYESHPSFTGCPQLLKTSVV